MPSDTRPRKTVALKNTRIHYLIHSLRSSTVSRPSNPQNKAMVHHLLRQRYPLHDGSVVENRTHQYRAAGVLGRTRCCCAVASCRRRANYRKRDVIHKTGSDITITTPPCRGGRDTTTQQATENLVRFGRMLSDKMNLSHKTIIKAAGCRNWGINRQTDCSCTWTIHYRAIARYWHGNPVCLSVCYVRALWWHRLQFSETNIAPNYTRDHGSLRYTAHQSNSRGTSPNFWRKRRMVCAKVAF